MKTRKASIILFHKNGKVLVQDRESKKNRKGSHRYGLFGGGAEAREDPEETLIREIKEELNVNIKDSFIFFKNYKEKRRDLNLILDLDVFLAAIPSQIICSEGDPHFSNLDKILSLDFSSTDLKILKDIIKHLSNPQAQPSRPKPTPQTHPTPSTSP